MFKKLCSLSLVIFILLALNVTTFASPSNHTHEHVSIGDVIPNEKGAEIVIKVNQDESFYTMPLAYSLSRNQPPCAHSNLQTTGSYSQKESYNGSSSTNCYRTRTVQTARCIRCGRSDFKLYGSWINYSHSYPLFSKQCKNCSYKK